MAIAKVEPLTTARALRGPFDYRLPERLGEVGVGSVLLVPFGRRRVIGVVVDVAESSELPPERLAEPIEALAAGATPELVRLGIRVAREYCSTPARGLELVLPPTVGRAGRGAGPRLETLAAATAAGRAALGDGTRLGPRQRRALERLAGERAGRRRALGAPSSRPTAGSTGRRWAAWRRGGWSGCATSNACGARGWWRSAPHRAGRRCRPSRARRSRRSSRRWTAAPRREHLLHGVTGSGKTEVYLAATEAALERGKGAIVLVPEIGLTPQAISRFAARFGDRVALLHSRLAPGERRDEWQRLHSGQARICVGPRSAVFAPVSDLGLMVIDEEHDASYKQEGDPRYDAREVARHRASEAGAALLAGSATPRPESWLGLRRLELTCRADGRELPPVEIVDLRGGSPRSGPLHPRTLEALAEPSRGERQGDRPPEPAWLVAVRLLPGLRARLPVRSLRGLAGPPQARAAPSVSPLRPRRAGLGVVPRVRLGGPRPPRRRHRAPGHPARPGGGAPARVPPRLRQRRPPGWPCRDPAPLPGGGVGRPGGHPDGRQGTRLPRCGAERGARRRRDASLPRLPRRGAHLRARGPARRAQRARRAGRAGAGPDPGARGRGDPPRGGARRPGLPRRRAGAPPSASLSALLAPDPDRADVGRGRARRRRSPNGFTGRWRTACPPAPSSWGRRPASGCEAATAVSCCSRPSTGRRRWPPSARRSRGSPGAGELRGAAVSVDVDPQ